MQRSLQPLHPTCERPVHGGEEAVGVSGARDDARLVEEQRAEPGGRRPQRRVDDRRRDGDPVTRVRDAALFARCEDCFSCSFRLRKDLA